MNDFFFGKGLFFDQLYLKYMEKTSSNSWINILFNAGIIALLVYLIFIFIFLRIFFKIKNINHNNIYISTSHYLFIYFLIRSLFEDTLAFLSVDFLLFFICISIIKETKK
jgi:O-antigen ligase